MTIYYQFGSKRRLLEALFDDLAACAELGPRVIAALGKMESFDALSGVLAAFVHFWERDRLVMRRVRALAMLDPEFGEAVRARDERRCQIVQTALRHTRDSWPRTQRHGPTCEAPDARSTWRGIRIGN
ncbi:MAG: TetR/AcrR family transcriptional regulator [Dehalococcoidia bacterium]